MRRRPRLPSVEWDGKCSHPSGLREPWEMVEIAKAKIDAMETHPGLQWLRDEDAEAARTPIGGKQFHVKQSS